MAEEVKRRKKSKKNKSSSKVTKQRFTKENALNREQVQKKGVGREKLARLVESGELTAYREKYDMSKAPRLYFKEEDIQAVLESDELVAYVPTGMVEETEEIVETEAPAEESA